MATDINALLAKSDPNSATKVTILKPEANNNYYVAVGELVSESKGILIDKDVKDKALKVLVQPSTNEDKATARLLGKGDIYKSSALF